MLHLGTCNSTSRWCSTLWWSASYPSQSSLFRWPSQAKPSKLNLFTSNILWSEPAGHRRARCVEEYLVDSSQAFHCWRRLHRSKYDHQGMCCCPSICLETTWRYLRHGWYIWNRPKPKVKTWTRILFSWMPIQRCEMWHSPFLQSCRCGWTRQQTTTYSSFWKTNSQGKGSVYAECWWSTKDSTWFWPFTGQVNDDPGNAGIIHIL